MSGLGRVPDRIERIMNHNFESSLDDANDAAQRELSWLAFRYVSGEMSSAEAADFEARLADDELACVAVAEAVQLNEVVFAALDIAHRPSGSAAGRSSADASTQPRAAEIDERGTAARRSSGASAMVSGLVTMVILAAVLLPWMVSPEDSNVARIDRDQPEDDRLLVASAERLLIDQEADAVTEAASEMLRLWVAPEPSLIARIESFERPGPEDTDDLIAEIPDWLFAAVQAEAGLLDASPVHVEEN